MSEFKFLILSIFITFTLPLKSMNPELISLKDLLPDTINGWTPAKEDRYFDKTSLYDYINGSAELFISYGFKNVISRTYSKEDQPDVIVEIFEMITSENAFGIFSNQRDSNNINFGQGAQYIEGSLIFWKDHYFISVVTHEENQDTKETILKLAKEIDEAIKTEGEIPDIVRLLPKKSLVKDGICFFRHYIWLNNYFFISTENILNINKNTNALIAKYGSPEERYFLIIIEYQNPNKAQKAYSKFAINYAMELFEDEIVQTEDEKWIGCRWSGRILILAFNAPDNYIVEELFDQVCKRIK